MKGLHQQRRRDKRKLGGSHEEARGGNDSGRGALQQRSTADLSNEVLGRRKIRMKGDTGKGIRLFEVASGLEIKEASNTHDETPHGARKCERIDSADYNTLQMGGNPFSIYSLGDSLALEKSVSEISPKQIDCSGMKSIGSASVTNAASSSPTDNLRLVDGDGEGGGQGSRRSRRRKKA